MVFLLTEHAPDPPPRNKKMFFFEGFPKCVMLQGAGWIKLEQMYSAADVERAKEVVYHHNQADKRNVTLNKHKHETRDEAHNKYNGLVWALFNKGRIFEKMAQHPVILNISNVILGETSQISSLAANTVLPGQEGQLPHLDYPYYRCSTPQQYWLSLVRAVCAL